MIKCNYSNCIYNTGNGCTADSVELESGYCQTFKAEPSEFIKQLRIVVKENFEKEINFYENCDRRIAGNFCK